MSQENYYVAPSQEIFEEIKEQATKIWKTYDDTFGYASEKTGRIKNIQNIRDNAMYIVAMFDENNRGRLLSIISEEAKQFIESNLE